MRAVLVAVAILLTALEVSAQDRTPSEFFDGLRAANDKAPLRALITAMPKGADLHSHLSGAIPVDAALSVAIRNDYWVAFDAQDGTPLRLYRPGRNPELDRACESEICERLANLTVMQRDTLVESLLIKPNDATRGYASGFVGFEEVFARLDELTDNTDMMPQLLEEVMDEASRHGVLFLELRVNPLGRRNSTGDLIRSEDLLSRLSAAAERKTRSLTEAGQVPTTARFFVAFSKGSAERSGGPTSFGEIACSPDCPSRLHQGYYLAKQLPGAVGIDLYGLPETYIVDRDYLAQALAPLRALHGDVPISLHAGETRDQSWAGIDDALSAGVQRLGHGFNLAGRSAASAAVCAGNVHIETSLTSNLLLGLVDDDDLSNHPFPTFFRREICADQDGWLSMSLNTDDAGVFGTTMSDEYFLAVTSFDLSWDELKRLARESLSASFAPDPLKARLLSEWDRRIDEFEKTRMR